MILKETCISGVWASDMGGGDTGLGFSHLQREKTCDVVCMNRDGSHQSSLHAVSRRSIVVNVRNSKRASYWRTLQC